MNRVELHRFVENYVAPVVATGLIIYSKEHKQSFIVQLLVTWTGRWIIRDSPSVLLKSILASYLTTSYAIEFDRVSHFKVLQRRVLNRAIPFNDALDMNGYLYISLTWLWELFKANGNFVRFEREYLQGIGVLWVLMSLYMSR